MLATCEKHGECDHALCDYCGKSICTICVYVGEVRYHLFVGERGATKDCVIVACASNAHAAFIEQRKPHENQNR